jgi:hypothetical protein
MFLLLDSQMKNSVFPYNVSHKRLGQESVISQVPLLRQSLEVVHHIPEIVICVEVDASSFRSENLCERGLSLESEETTHMCSRIEQKN